MVCKHCEFYRKGTFHSTQNSGNFGWYIKSNRPFRFGLTRILNGPPETVLNFRTVSGGPLWLVRSFRSLGPKSPFQFDKIVVPSTSFLFPAYENNNQTHGGLGWVCATGMYHSIGHMKFLKFQTRFFPLTFPISLSVQDQLRFLGDWPPTPSLSQSFFLRNE